MAQIPHHNSEKNYATKRNSRVKFKQATLVLFIVFVTLFFTGKVFSQNFENVTITGIISGQNTENALFSATSPTIPSLAFVRVQKIAGSATVDIDMNLDNFVYWHRTPTTSGIPNNYSRARISFLQSDQTTPIPFNDFRFIINDIDGPDNEAIGIDCGDNLRFTATADPTNLSIDNTPPILSATGTQIQTGQPESNVMYEFNDVSSIVFDNYANADFVKIFDLNQNDFSISTPLYVVCLGDADGDGITDDVDLDDDNDGILDVDETGGNDPNGDHDGDGLPNFLDTTDNTGDSATYIANADGSTTDYTDANSDGVPDIYEASADADDIPNHLDLDSDGDGCPDAIEGGASFTMADLDVDNSLGDVVDPDGIPTISGSPQTVGSSQDAVVQDPDCPPNPCDAAASGNTDSDGDNVSDICDLDNDNDGILDTDEGLCTSTLVSGNAIAQTNIGVTDPTFALGSPDGAYAVIQFGDLLTVELGDLVPEGEIISITLTLGNRFADFNIESSADNSTFGGLLVYNATSGATLGVLETISYTVPVGGAKYVRFTPNGGVLIVDALAYSNIACTPTDTDNDGILDYLDVDSDNDGCPDAIEGGGSFTSADLDANDSLLGTVDADGVPTITGSPQTIGDSQNPAVQSADCVLIDPCDPIASGNPDTDNDGVSDICDLDNDNDGILDTDEGKCVPTQSGIWSISGTTATYDFGNGAIAKAETTTSTVFTSGNFNLAGSGFWSEPLEGDTSLQNDYIWDSSLTVNFEDSLGNPVVLENPIIHLDRIGGGDGVEQNAAEVTLQGGLTWSLITGTTDFEVTATTVTDGGAGTPPDATYTAESTMADSDGTASGSLQINGAISSFTVSFVQNGVDAAGADGIELILFTCLSQDTDNDGIPDHLDTDSDNDGCPDAIEGGGLFTGADLDVNEMLTGGVDIDGIPLIAGSGQATSSAVIDSNDATACNADLSLTKIVDNATPSIGDTIVFTITVTNSGPNSATGVKVKDFLDTDLIFDLANSTIPLGTTYDSSTGIWDLSGLTINVDASIILELAVTIGPNCGVITNVAQIIDSAANDPDSTPNNGQ